MYRITFNYKNKTYEIRAKKIDLSYPYLISVTDLFFEDQARLVISPDGDDARKRFGEVKNLLIPFGQILLIEEIEREKIRKFDMKKLDPSISLNGILDSDHSDTDSSDDLDNPTV